MEWLTKNWKVIIIGILGIIAGYLANVYANKASEKRIIDTLTAEIEAIKSKQQTSRISATEQNRIIELQAQINILKSSL